jgi:hypothetical protein
MDFLAPFPAPFQVIVNFFFVVVDIVVVANVKGRISEDQVDALILDLAESLKTVALKQEIQLHGRTSLLCKYTKVHVQVKANPPSF